MKAIRPGVLGVAGVLFLVAVALIGWEASFTNRPGPTEYYSHFSGLFFASALAFDALQSLKHTLRPSQRKPAGIIPRFLTYLTYLYWAVLTISGLICSGGYGLTPKADAVSIQVLIFLNGAVVSAKLAADHWSSKKLNDDNATHRNLEGVPRRKKWLFSIGRYGNRLLKFVRFVISVLFIVGAVDLARQYGFKNPGTAVQVTLASGKSLSISCHCTNAPSANSTSLPTIWFESSPAHGVTDFFNLQTILLDTYGRNSCSYDPPNFGWSSRWPSSEPANLTTVLNPLVIAVQRQHEDKVLVGWGGGVENVLRNSRLNTGTVKGVVLLDASPNGIEWLDRKRDKNLTTKETLDFAKMDMQGRVTLAQIILALGVPW
ncbi:hypothetical protein BCR34DRAFT_178688 [Clohesyomyces aquaticus]|uniref:Uncharacterized protein n=1 Tax=Clohesyomyces aquaticus TaxID=1231657 RepID=A0A1Y1ZZ68_9PLEO|nr:hypothetical protein BCR34DRAFT_178688 [Clohesyomyces aquaticus]